MNNPTQYPVRVWTRRTKAAPRKRSGWKIVWSDAEFNRIKHSAVTVLKVDVR